MLLQRLKEYAERLPATLPPMYQEQPIRYLIELDVDGTPRGIVPRGESGGGGRRGDLVPAPYVKRTVAVRPKLLADTAEYVLGLPRPGSKPERVREQHERFVELVSDCAAVTGDEQVRAVATFLAGLDLDTLPLPQGFDPAANITFSFEGELPIEHEAIQRYWARAQGAGTTTQDGEEAEGAGRRQCIVCGAERPVLRRHPIRLRGIPGGQIAKDLISANQPAFESYGLNNSLIAPTCQACAEAYGNAMNTLLAEPATHLRMKETAYVFWAAGETSFDLAGLFDKPEDRDVQQLFLAPIAAEPGALVIDPTEFYAICLGPSGARVVVRDWIDTTVSAAKWQLARYFVGQALVNHDGSPGPWLPIWRLANATVRDPRKEEPPAAVPGALLRFALVGTPLPWDLLYQAVRRIRSEGDIRRDRAVVIKMVLASRSDGGREDSMVQLDPTNTRPAYLYGRLLALLDSIQQAAISPNATLVDKFYGTASSAPASVFGTMLRNAQPHLAKLRKHQDPRKQRAFVALDRQIGEVIDLIDVGEGFSPTLSLPDQGYFALGFYHQRAHDQRLRGERAAANAARDSVDRVEETSDEHPH